MSKPISPAELFTPKRRDTFTSDDSKKGRTVGMITIGSNSSRPASNLSQYNRRQGLNLQTEVLRDVHYEFK
jgi:hypothetical protein